MQKQASVGELLAGQIRLRKQADGNAPRSGVVGRIGDKLNDWLGWKKRPRGWSNPPKRTPDPMSERTTLPSPRQPLPAPNRPTQGRVVPLPAPNRFPMPDRSPLPAPTPGFPSPRGIRGPWDRPDEQPNDPMENERIRRLVEGNNAPAPGGGSVGRPIDDSEIPLPSEDPGVWTPPKNTPPKNIPSIPSINPEELQRSFQEFNKNWRHHIMPMKMPDGSWSRSRWEWIGPGERPKEGPEVFEKYYKQYPSLRGGW